MERDRSDGVGVRGGCGAGRGVSGARAHEQRVWSDGELLAALRRFARKVRGRAFTVREFAAWENRPCSQNTIIKRFGSWPRALKRIGVDGSREREYSADELLEEYLRVRDLIGRPPGERVIMLESRRSINAFKRRWGTIGRLSALVRRMEGGEISREDVLRAGAVVESGDGARGRRAGGTRRGISVEVRWRVLKRDGYRCVACGASPAMRAGVELEVDHIVPVSAGGGDEEGNLRTLCRGCNVGRVGEWRGRDRRGAAGRPRIVGAIRDRRRHGRRMSACRRMRVCERPGSGRSASASELPRIHRS